MDLQTILTRYETRSALTQTSPVNQAMLSLSIESFLTVSRRNKVCDDYVVLGVIRLLCMDHEVVGPSNVTVDILKSATESQLVKDARHWVSSFPT
jgi:hypothetical protein